MFFQPPDPEGKIGELGAASDEDNQVDDRKDPDDGKHKEHNNYFIRHDALPFRFSAVAGQDE
jgi:hypothetical protein